MNRWPLVVLVATLAPAAHAEPEPMTFADAVRRAIARNPDRQIALEEIARVTGLLTQATSALLPQVGLTGLYTRLEGDRLLAGRIAYAANSVTGDVNVTAPIVNLHTYAERKRAKDNVAVTAADAESVKRDVAIATARAYFAAYAASRLLEIAVHARDAAQATVDYSRSRHTGGVGNDLDVARAEAQLATTEADVAAASIAKVRAQEALGVITGTEHPIVAAVEPDLGVPRVGPGIADRADVIASRRRRLAATASQREDWMDWVPTVGIAGDGFVGAPEIDPIPRWGYQIIFTLDVRLFDGGYRLGTHQQHLAVEAEAVEHATGVTRQAESDVRTAQSDVESTRISREAARRASAAATRTFELANEGYRAGTATNLEVVQAEQVALDAATRALIAEDQYRQAELDLLAATAAFP